jgi:pimeloyl-ACP methyl ester carboxylesterase
MKLAYRVLEAEGAGPSAVLVHGQGGVPIDELTAFARRCGLSGDLVVPFGDYATTASGMEIAGPCWYRSLPGDAGTDPLTLTRAVVQLADLLADVGLDRPVLVGWRQGATVAVGAALLAPMSTGGVVAVDIPSAHLSLLPAALTVAIGAPPVFLAGSGSVEGADAVVALDELTSRGVAAEVGHGSDLAGSEATDGQNDGAMTDAVGRFVRTSTGRAGAEGSTGTS